MAKILSEVQASSLVKKIVRLTEQEFKIYGDFNRVDTNLIFDTIDDLINDLFEIHVGIK